MQHALSIIVLGAAWVGAGVIACFALYYQAQAIQNVKPNSPWYGRIRWAKGYIPRSEFTERGLWYRHRFYIVQLIFAAWAFLVVAPAVFWAAASAN
jgi:hypothetical protein